MACTQTHTHTHKHLQTHARTQADVYTSIEHNKHLSKPTVISLKLQVGHINFGKHAYFSLF